MASLDSKPEEFDPNKTYGDDAIVALSQAILKREWERVKRGD